MEDKTKKYLIIGAIVVLVILFIIPANHWNPPITSGRYTNTAEIVSFSKDGESMKVQLYDADRSNKTLKDCYLTIKGNIPASAYEGQKIIVGYSKDGLLEDTKQSVQVSYEESTNALVAWIIDNILPFRVCSEDYKITDTKLDGSLLSYNKMK